MMRTKMENTLVNKKIRKGDNVLVVAGNAIGQSGVVLSRTNKSVLVQGINKRKKCIKPTQMRPKGDIIEVEMPINASNVQLCSENGTKIKAKVRTDKNGDRQLVYQDNGQEKIYRSLKKPK